MCWTQATLGYRKANPKRIGDLLAELKHCTNTRNLGRGKALHAESNEVGQASSIYVATAVVKMYSKCGSMVDAHNVFNTINSPDVVAWSTLILGYVENGECATALDLFASMRAQGCTPNHYTCAAAIKACSLIALKEDECGKAKYRELGKQIHASVGCHSDNYVISSLIDMYSNCGCMSEARELFDTMKCPTVVAWNSLILGYAENGELDTALDMFAGMKYYQCTPNAITYVAALKACTYLAVMDHGSRKPECSARGRKIHSEIGHHINIYVKNALIDMYAKCGSMVEAREVFDGIKTPDVVSWTTLILGYADNGDGFTALDMFARMKFQGSRPDSKTFVAAIKACTSFSLGNTESGKSECLERGKQIHSEIGCHLDIYVQSSLIDMYSKCGDMVKARQVFDGIKNPNVVSWNTLILGYIDNGEGETALNMYAKMRSQNCTPNYVTFVAAIKACTFLGALEFGKKIHSEIDLARLCNAAVVTALVDLYAKGGKMIEAERVFNLYPEIRDLTTWTALLVGYSRLGNIDAVFELFENMEGSGFRPNNVTLLCVLNCCSHGGLVENARSFFERIPAFGVAPTIEHYNCMIDILGRSNRIDDAVALLRNMSLQPNVVTWMTVLGACSKWKNVEIGRLAFQSLLGLDNVNSNVYVLMANICGNAGMPKEEAKMLNMLS